MPRRSPWTVAALLALLLAPVLVGCGADVLERSTVERSAADALEQQAGVRPQVDCPADLPAEVGASTECTLTAGEDPTGYPVTVTVLSVENGTARFDVQVGDQPAD